MAAPPALPGDMIAEILIRLPQDDPSSLLRASLACKRWLEIATGPDFRRGLGAFHPTPPLLGFLRGDDYYEHAPSFTATTASAFSLPGAAGPFGIPLDCRHGRVLFLASNELLLVWEPMTGALRRVPTPAAFDNVYFMPNTTLVCAVSSCDHHSCIGGHFLIVFVFSKTDGGPMVIESETVAELCVYSSETEAWDDEPTTVYVDSIVKMKRSVLVGRTLYIPLEMGYILEYDLCGRGLVVIQIPDLLLATKFDGNLMLMPVEGSRLGVAGIEGSCLSVWSSEVTGHGDVVWGQHRVIDLSSLLPAEDGIEVLGFAERVNVIFLGTYGGIFTIKLDPEMVSRVCGRGNSEMLLPFISFCTPGSASFLAPYREA